MVYFGTPDDSAVFLKKLLNNKTLPLEVVLVVTQSNRKIGRKQIFTPSPVKQIAASYKIPVVANLNELVNKKYDLGLLLFYGKIIPRNILDCFSCGIWNIHFSSLPKYKGGAPYAQAIINGDREVGITIFKMDEKLDHGPIIEQKLFPILPKERASVLSSRLTDISYQMMKNIFNKYGSNLQDIPQKEQDYSKATYTRLLAKKDGFVEISNLIRQLADQNSTEKLFDLFRGLYPWPGIWTRIKVKGREQRLKITDMDCENGKVIIKKVQLEGKKEADFNTFNRVYNIFPKITQL